MHSDALAARLDRVRRRIESDVPYSPDWAAAVDELEELEAALGVEPVAIIPRQAWSRAEPDEPTAA